MHTGTCFSKQAPQKETDGWAPQEGRLAAGDWTSTSLHTLADFLNFEPHK